MSLKLQDFEVVMDFLIVFLGKLPGLLLDREIEFSIDLVFKIVPISKVPYHMALVELKELKD